jgi:hypothetical protein
MRLLGGEGADDDDAPVSDAVDVEVNLAATRGMLVAALADGAGMLLGDRLLSTLPPLRFLWMLTLLDVCDGAA